MVFFFSEVTFFPPILDPGCTALPSLQYKQQSELRSCLYIMDKTMPICAKVCTRGRLRAAMSEVYERCVFVSIDCLSLHLAAGSLILSPPFPQRPLPSPLLPPIADQSQPGSLSPVPKRTRLFHHPEWGLATQQRPNQESSSMQCPPVTILKPSAAKSPQQLERRLQITQGVS